MCGLCFFFGVLFLGSHAFFMVPGMLKSIMKRKDASNSGENRITGKKSLQFVGILNGG